MVSLIMILPLFEMARTSTFVSSHASFLIFPRPPTPLHEHWICDSFRGITSINRISSIKPWLRCLVFMQAPCPVSSSPHTLLHNHNWGWIGPASPAVQPPTSLQLGRRAFSFRAIHLLDASCAYFWELPQFSPRSMHEAQTS